MHSNKMLWLAQSFEVTDGAPDTYIAFIENVRSISEDVAVGINQHLNEQLGGDFSLNVFTVPNGVVIEVNPEFYRRWNACPGSRNIRRYY